MTTENESFETNGTRLIHVTFFRDEYAKTKTTKDMAVWDLRDLILTTSADAKTDLQLLKPARFGDTPTDKNCLRYDANVLALFGVAAEHDASTMSFDEAIRRLRTAMVTALVYTSPSHTEEKPRWRVIAPTSDSWSPAQHARLVARINGVLGGVLAPESFTLSQPYYYGRINGNPYHRAEYTVGEYINLRFDLDAGAIYKKSKSKTSNRQLTDVVGIRPDIPITSLSDDRLKPLPAPALYMIEHAAPPNNASEKVRALKGGKGHCYVVGALVRAGLNNAQIKAVYRLGAIANGPRNHSRGFDGYVERVIALCRSREQEQADAPASKSVVTIRASDVVIRPKQWVWENHLLRGALELMTGVPDLGKSQVQIHYVACVTTTRPWPDGTRILAPANVLMITAEDTLDQEVVPRLIAAGADLTRVEILKYIKTDKKTQRQFLLAEDLDAIERTIKEMGDVALVTIDPITAYMGGKMDSHKATEVRGQLGPLKDFAERTGVAVSAITHPAKNTSQRAIDQFIGSQAFIAAARLGHACIKEFKEEKDAEGKKQKVETGRVFFTHVKHNPCARQPTWAYRIEVVGVGRAPQVIDAARVVWDKEPEDITADAAVAAAAGTQRSDERGKQDQLQNFLCERLKAGPVPAAKIEGEVKSMGFTKSQIETAKKKLGIVSEKSDFDGGWVWKLILQ